jgi:hypothetical protein
MSQPSWNEIQDRATEFASKWAGETYEKGESQSFWSDFLGVFDIDRRRHGAFFEYAIKKGSGSQGFIDMFWPGKILAEQKSAGKDLGKAGVQAYEYLETMPDHDLPEAIIVSDFASFECINLETREKTSFTLQEFPKNVKLFGFLLSQDSKKLAEADPVNVKAAEAMAKLHNQLKDDNYTGHDLEVLLVRLVFCMFADDSGIFDHQVLQQYVAERTNDDGSDLGPRLMQIFQALNTPPSDRQSSLDEAIASLPYVNGGLFAESIRTPYFDSAMRGVILETMRLDWASVSPAIFGSMFQSVMDKAQRRNLGAHYTSEKNILRVIKPLFLDDLYKDFAIAAKAGPRKKFDELRALQDKLANLKFLDPACGAGNFLVITYRELRRLEHKIVAHLSKNADQQDMLASAGVGVGTLKVNVDQMYGIEIEEFPSLIAQTALWLTDHQMNMEYSRESGKMFKRLPLTSSATIVNDNALTIDWEEVVNPSELDYILGNPPFIGSKMMTTQMREQLLAHFQGVKSAGVLDFVTAWYVRAAAIMKQNLKIQTALVSTNSIIQGEQVSILWKHLFKEGVKINFLHQTFKWSNDAKGNAAVYCTIVGFALFKRSEKQIFEYADIKGESNEIIVKNINGYGIEAPSVFIESRTKPVCDVPKIGIGNKPIDGGNYLFTADEKIEFINKEPQSIKYFHQWIGSREFLHNELRYVLWLGDANPSDLRQMPESLRRIEAVKQLRLKSKSASTRKLAYTPTRFHVENIPRNNYIVIPEVSSERREYVPIGFMSPAVFASNLVKVIPNATRYDFGVLTSQIHMAWMRAVAGRLKSDYRYSKDIVYNNFIWPEASDEQKATIEQLAQAVLDARAEFPEASLADLYDPNTMPPALTKAHKALDRAVDKLYRKEPFATDAERVAMLFERYQAHTASDK